MQSKVQRWGNSLAVRLPKPFAQDVGLREDSPVEISAVDRGLVIQPSAARPFSLRELLAEVTDENIHQEISTGPIDGSGHSSHNDDVNLMAEQPEKLMTR